MTAALATGAIVALVAVAGLVAVAYVSRVRTLTGRVGSFVCVVRAGGIGPAWVTGIAVYGVGRLSWYRALSLSPRPARVWARGDLLVLGRDDATGAGEDRVVLHCRHVGEVVEDFDIGLSVEASAGLTSWIEAAPPRARRPVF